MPQKYDDDIPTPCPSSVDLGYTKITIEETSGDRMSDDARGEYDHTTHRVNFLRGMEDRERAWVVLHELLHAIWGQYDLGAALAIDDEEAAEEHIVHALGTGLAELLRRNPKLVQFLVAGLNK